MFNKLKTDPKFICFNRVVNMDDYDLMTFCLYSLNNIVDFDI